MSGFSELSIEFGIYRKTSRNPSFFTEFWATNFFFHFTSSILQITISDKPKIIHSDILSRDLLPLRRALEHY